MSSLIGLRRGIQVLELLAVTPAGLSFSALQAHFRDLAPSTLTRLLGVLAEEGLIGNAEDTRGYILADRAHELGLAITGKQDIAAKLKPYLCELALASGFSSVFFQIQGEEIILSAKHELAEAFHYADVGNGARFPVEHGCAKICLAHMPRKVWKRYLDNPGRALPRPRKTIERELRELQGCSVYVSCPDDQPGLTRVAAPVLQNQECVGAIGVSLFQRLGQAQIKKVAGLVEAVAGKASGGAAQGALGS